MKWHEERRRKEKQQMKPNEVKWHEEQKNKIEKSIKQREKEKTWSAKK